MKKITRFLSAFLLVMVSINVFTAQAQPCNPVLACNLDTVIDAPTCAPIQVYWPPMLPYSTDIEFIYTSHGNGSYFSVGTTTVTVFGDDYCGGTTTCSFDITINPPANPPATSLSCPADITTPATSCTGANVNFDALADPPAAVDYIDYSPAQNSHFNIGTTAVTATVHDYCGNTSSCTFNVTVTPFITINAGADVSSIFGFASTQTINRTAIVTGGSGSKSYSWTLSRSLKCNFENSTGDELFTGGSCTNNLCPTIGSSTSSAPACSGSSTISATLLDNATVCVTVTDGSGCIASDCFQISAMDGRCLTGNAGKNKTRICHKAGNSWVSFCIPKTIATNYLANHPGDYAGPCVARLGNTEDEATGGLLFYPNPFSSTGTIRFTPIEDSHAELEVFNSVGAKLPTIFSGDVYADEQKEFSFDGSNLMPGIYLCKLTIGNEVHYTKMVLNK
jgi:hypothetical protein